MTTLAQSEPDTLPDTAGGPVADPVVLHLPLGLLGFEEVKKYALITQPEAHPFHWLQMLEAPHHAFLVVPPSAVTPDYHPNLSDEDVAFLQLSSPDDAVILNIVTLRSSGASTVNLKGPVVFNRHSRTGKQVIPTNAADFTLQHPLPAAS